VPVEGFEGLCGSIISLDRIEPSARFRAPSRAAICMASEFCVIRIPVNRWLSDHRVNSTINSMSPTDSPR
jgi:hypothetical protein